MRAASADFTAGVIIFRKRKFCDQNTMKTKAILLATSLVLSLASAALRHNKQQMRRRILAVRRRVLYLNPALSPEARAKDLVGRMTLEEKVSQMQDIAPAIPRLGVPAYNWWNEALHGVARNGFATNFPQSIGLAATWDTR